MVVNKAQCHDEQFHFGWNMTTLVVRLEISVLSTDQT